MLSFVKTIFKIATTSFLFFSIIFSTIYHSSVAEEIGTQKSVKPVSILNEGIITTIALNLRGGPGNNYKPIITLKKGTRVKILDNTKDWLKVSYKGQIGFIRNREKYVQIIKKIVPEHKPDLKSKYKPEQKPEYKPDPQNLKEPEKIAHKIRNKKNKIKYFSNQETYTSNEIKKIDLTLNKISIQASALKDQIKKLQKEIIENKSKAKKLEKIIEKNRKYAKKRVNILYKTNRIGKLYLPETAESIFEFIKTQSALKQIIAKDFKFLEKLGMDKKRYLSLNSQLKMQQQDKDFLETQLQKQILTMEYERKKRTELIKDIQNKRAKIRAAIVALELSARALDKKVKSFKKVKKQNILVKKKNKKAFSFYKGLLKPPVTGKVISYFGRSDEEKHNVVTFQNGINFKAKKGSPIRVISDGKVLFANNFKGYGNMIIVDHGDSYYSLYAHAEELFKSKDDLVEKGEVIATVGTAAPNDDPVLHFEIRYHGKPVNPIKWLSF